MRGGNDQEVPLGQVLHRWHELNDTHNVYDRMGAATSQDDLLKMWWALGSITLFVSITCTIVLLGILTHRPTRRKAFNMYICFLTVPDLIYSGLCVFTCWLSAANGSFSSEQMCNLQSFYLQFGLSANAWVNAVIAWEVYRLLTCSTRRERYFPPTRKQVAWRCAGAYALCGGLAALPFIESSVLPQVGLYAGYFCYPSTFNLASDLFYWIVYNPLAFGLPYLYVFWVSYDVFVRSNLMPPSGKRRDLSIFFFRISFVFLAMWMPVIVIVFMCRGRIQPWVVWSTGSWSHFQGSFSALVACCKPDIYAAVQRFLFCRFREDGRSSLSSFFRYYSRPSVVLEGESSHSKMPSKLSKFSSAFPSSAPGLANNYDDDIPAQGPDFQFEGENVTSFSIVENGPEMESHELQDDKTDATTRNGKSVHFEGESCDLELQSTTEEAAVTISGGTTEILPDPMLLESDDDEVIDA